MAHPPRHALPPQKTQAPNWHTPGTGDTKTQSPDPTAKRHWKFPKAAFIAAVIIVLGAGVMLYPQTAAWFNQVEQARVIGLGLEALQTTPNNDEIYRQEQLAAAHAYNDALASGVLVEANTNKPTGSGTTTSDADYNSLLKIGNEGIMARLTYEKVGVDLPVFHGTTDEVLNKAVGHLEGTSLPVGGVGTRSVLTAHRGLSSATMFTHLDKAKMGDVFTVETMGETLAYSVVDYQVIQPDETESLVADPDRDLVTLITCTPLGINTHRILVTGERVFPTPVEVEEAAGQASVLPHFPWWALMFTGSIVLAAGYVWWAGYPAKPRAAKTPRAAHPPHRARASRRRPLQ